MKRSRSSFSLRELYPPIPQDESIRLEKSVQEIIDSKIKVNKRYVAGLVCLVLAGIVLIIVMGLSFIGAIIAFLIAICLVHILRKAWRRYRLNRMKLSREKNYEIRLSCLNIYLKTLKKSRLSLNDFQGLLEKIFQEFLPAIILQTCNIGLFNQIQLLIKFLKSDAVHSCMLNSAIKLEFAITHKENPVIAAARLRKFYIPVMVLLKQPQDKENQELEIVRRISDILTKEETQMLLLTCKIQNDNFLKRIATFWQLSDSFKETYPMCRFFSDVDSLCNPSNRGLSPKLMLFRRNSFDDLKPETCKSTSLLSVVKKASENFIGLVNLNESVCLDKSGSVQQSFSKNDNEKFLQMSTSPILSFNAKRAPALFEGDNIQDLDKDSGSERESEKEDELATSVLINKTYEAEEPERVIENSVNIQLSEGSEAKSDEEAIQLIHPFIDCFDQLLAIEKEPNSEKVWRIVVNKPETKCYQKKVENSPLCMIKAFCDVNYSARTVYTAIWDTSIRTQWDSVFHEFRLIDKQEDYEILYYMIKTPFGITKRDWLQRRVEIHDYPEPGTIIMHFVSMDHHLMPPKKGIIRAETLISGYVIRPTGDNTCRVMIVSQNDVKGLIPKAIVNSVASKAPADWVNSMNRGCKLVAGY